MAVEDALKEHARLERQPSFLLVLVARQEWDEVEFVLDHLSDDPRQVVRGEPLVEIEWEARGLLRVVSAEDGAVTARHESPSAGTTTVLPVDSPKGAEPVLLRGPSRRSRLCGAA